MTFLIGNHYFVKRKYFQANKVNTWQNIKEFNDEIAIAIKKTFRKFNEEVDDDDDAQLKETLRRLEIKNDINGNQEATHQLHSRNF